MQIRATMVSVLIVSASVCNSGDKKKTPKATPEASPPRGWMKHIPCLRLTGCIAERLCRSSHPEYGHPQCCIGGILSNTVYKQFLPADGPAETCNESRGADGCHSGECDGFLVEQVRDACRDADGAYLLHDGTRGSHNCPVESFLDVSIEDDFIQEPIRRVVVGERLILVENFLPFLHERWTLCTVEAIVTTFNDA